MHARSTSASHVGSTLFSASMLAAALACLSLASGCSGGDKQAGCSVAEGDQCESSDDCPHPSIMACSGNCTCACSFLMGAACDATNECGANRTCNLQTCQCEGGAEIPPHTTDCTLDGDGCLVGGDTACQVEFVQTVSASTIQAQVEGTLVDDGMTNQFCYFRGFVGEITPPYVRGYTGRIERLSGSCTLGLEAADGNLQDYETWTPPTGDFPFVMEMTMDAANTSSSLSLTGEGAPTTPLQSSSMNTAPGNRLFLELWHSRVCRVIFTSP